MYSAVIVYNKGIDLLREVKGGFPGESMIKLTLEKQVGRKIMPCYYLVLFQFHDLKSEFPFDQSYITF